MVPNLIRSLLVSSLISFAAPIFSIGTILAVLSLIGYVPGLELVGKTAAEGVVDFLTVFGSGCAWNGIVTIAFCCALVGGLFDLSTFYRYQHLGSE
ncbi:hypothetical protein [Oscillatoria salina]|uniref:hypothetical protein n=1 Tax=Oscillatoria salina TaxID=331517 RepID=UPI0013B75229|nr:hypothetical protein [Oscillatoria salina]MBZ8180301.1 hypothetical protein [Oscillatoria salina IIICB1]NET86589.1 hypothetical protein [Kamptonema sp. SIO1D9]